MHDGAPPTPYATPPGIEEAVKEHLELVSELRDLRHNVAKLSTDVGRLADAETKDRLNLGRLERQVAKLEGSVGRLEVLMPRLEKVPELLERLAKHLGVVAHG